jgi:NAD-dependent DNA ligase
MNREEAKERIEKLKEIINEARYAYHVLNKDLYPPEVLDSLKKALFDLVFIPAGRLHKLKLWIIS